MPFAGKEELHRIVGIVHNLGKAVEISKQQMSALISGKATAETYQQSVRVDFCPSAKRCAKDHLDSSTKYHGTACGYSPPTSFS